jgi:hypothetical protein
MITLLMTSPRPDARLSNEKALMLLGVANEKKANNLIHVLKRRRQKTIEMNLAQQG